MPACVCDRSAGLACLGGKYISACVTVALAAVGSRFFGLFVCFFFY